jgi:hypothetical protein
VEWRVRGKDNAIALALNVRQVNRDHHGYLSHSLTAVDGATVRRALNDDLGNRLTILDTFSARVASTYLGFRDGAPSPSETGQNRCIVDFRVVPDEIRRPSSKHVHPLV